MINIRRSTGSPKAEQSGLHVCMVLYYLVRKITGLEHRQNYVL